MQVAFHKYIWVLDPFSFLLPFSIPIGKFSVILQLKFILQLYTTPYVFYPPSSFFTTFISNTQSHHIRTLAKMGSSKEVAQQLFVSTSRICCDTHFNRRKAKVASKKE